MHSYQSTRKIFQSSNSKCSISRFSLQNVSWMPTIEFKIKNF